jgi:peptidoglycan/xylan/chitin deacetylase (PgdA/CDA1 family)
MQKMHALKASKSFHAAFAYGVIASVSAALLTGCASTPSAPQPRRELLGRNEKFAIIMPRADDSYAAIAQRQLGQATQGWRIAEFNKYREIQVGVPVVVPLEDLNPTGVTQSGVQRVPILCYHRFAAGGKPDKLEVTAAQFEEQILYLKRNGFTVVSLADFHAFTLGKKQLPRKSVVITIDDGYRSIYSIAYPIIQKHRIPVTAYIYPDFLGSGAALNWAMIREMQSGGLIDFQSHSKSHTKLSAQGRRESRQAYLARIASELEASKAVISKQLGKAVSYIAYPYGGTDAYVADKTRDFGYANGTTVVRGLNAAYAPQYLLRRDMVFGSDSLAMFAQRLGVPPEKKTP